MISRFISFMGLTSQLCLTRTCRDRLTISTSLQRHLFLLVDPCAWDMVSKADRLAYAVSVSCLLCTMLMYSQIWVSSSAIRSETS